MEPAILYLMLEERVRLVLAEKRDFCNQGLSVTKARYANRSKQRCVNDLKQLIDEYLYLIHHPILNRLRVAAKT